MLQTMIEYDLSLLCKKTDCTDEDITTKNVLKLICSEFQRRKNLNVLLTDNEVCTILKKYLKNTDELAKYTKDPDVLSKLEAERTIIRPYLPLEATKEDIINFVKTLGEITPQMKGKAIGDIMRHFKGMDMCVDGNLVKSVLEEI